jgi:hypothetical protein
MTDFEPGFGDVLDPLWLVGLVGGGVGYLSGRSRRGSFVAATLGVLGLDVVHLIQSLSAPGPVRVAIGGAGAFGAIVVAGGGFGWISTVLGFLAVVFAMMNVVGGYAVTDRMLAMFRRKPDAR